MDSNHNRDIIKKGNAKKELNSIMYTDMTHRYTHTHTHTKDVHIYIFC